jgi:hypothetical protein
MKKLEKIEKIMEKMRKKMRKKMKKKMKNYPSDCKSSESIGAKFHLGSFFCPFLRVFSYKNRVFSYQNRVFSYKNMKKMRKMIEKINFKCENVIKNGIFYVFCVFFYGK